MQRGRVGGVEPNGAAIHVRERHYSSSTKPDEYKGHTHSDDVSLSYELGSVGREMAARLGRGVGGASEGEVAGT